MDKVITMYKLVFTIICIVITLSSGTTDNDYFADARDAPEFLKTINELIEERARQRFLEHWRKLQFNRNVLQRAEITGPSFTYHKSLLNSHQNQYYPIEFAVGPSDPRFYDSIVDKAYTKSNADHGNNQEQSLMYSNHNINLPPSPQDIKPKLPINENQLSLDYKLRNEEQVSDENMSPRRLSGVVQRPLEISGSITMYVVALIGGISAAVTVGLISIIVGWYTLHKKAKAAANVEYPAYGVTGPNKESSSTSDRKLAQSAQVYHYQHQKQQIIAMEHYSTSDNNVIHSDVESEDGNAEGDYTVYECPGLAPTGEMEVKNPLFMDDSTLKGKCMD